MDIVKNLWDADLTDDQEFFATLIQEEFGCGSRIEKIKNRAFINHYARPLNNFVVYNTAMPNSEGIRMLSWKRAAKSYK